MKRLYAALVLILIAAACQPSSNESQDLPTIAVIDTATPTDTPPPSPTDPPPSETPLPSDTPIPSATSPATTTPTITNTPGPTFDPTLAAIGTGTAGAIEAPVFSTFTPVSAGSSNAVPTTTPHLIADVVISERQFQEEVDRLVAAMPAVERARVDFIPDAIDVEVTALGGAAFTTGHVIISIVQTGSFATITISDITVSGGGEPPEAFVELATGDFFFMLVDAFDGILGQRLGDDHDLEKIVVTDETMEISLIVPAP